MAKYRKKPVIIEAFQWTDELFTRDMPDWMQDAIGKEQAFFKEGKLEIITLEGDHLANSGDYIIQGIKGELYPCKPDIFEQTYELIEE